MKKGQGNLRTCARCEWIYEGINKECPKCKFASYSAYYCYGKAAYRYKITQKPWLDKKLNYCYIILQNEIKNSVPKKKA